MVDQPPVFLYDFNSPYAYLAACRVDEVLPVRPRWQPVAFAFMLRAHGRRPWSFDPDALPVGIAECERRARQYGLPPMRWPPGWPVDSYGLISLRAALVADEHGRLREFSRAAFAHAFVDGRGLTELDDVVAVAQRAGLDPASVREGVADPRIKARLTEVTEAAIAAGARGVPTVRVGEALFWGDDRLPEAAAALRDDR